MRVAIAIAVTLFAIEVCVSYKLTILHTNDVHARIDEAHKYGGTCSPQQSADGDCVGGSARLYTEIKEQRSKGGNMLLIDGGDQFQGTFWFHVFRGQAAAQFMKKLGYDAMAIGNHEFDIGMAPLQDFINNISASDGFQLLSSNIDNTYESALHGFMPYLVKQVGGKSIGIVGYTTQETPELTALGNTGKLIFNDVVESIRSAIQTMKEKNPTVDIIIALGHAGFDTDQRIAKEVDDVDIVVGGHSNTFLWTGTPPSSEVPEANYPKKIIKNNGKIALCVQAFTFTKYLGNLTVDFDSSGNVESWTGNPIYLDNSVPKDPEIEAMMEPYREKVKAEGDMTIAKAAVRLNGNCRALECNFGNLVADAWIHSNVIFGTAAQWSKAAIALLNGGTIRSPIEQGEVSNAMLLNAMPFGNDIVAVTVTGKTLKDTFENSITAYDDDGKSGRFLQVAGVKVTYDLSKGMGDRVVNLRLRCLYCDIPRYEPLDLSANYTLLTSSYLAGGGDGYSMLLNDRVGYQNLGLSDSAMVDEYMRMYSVIYPAEEGRIRVINANKSH